MNNQTRLKHAFIDGSTKQFDYSGDVDRGLCIILSDGNYLNLQNIQIVEIKTIMAKYNPLLDDSTDYRENSSRVRFERWIEQDSLGYFGRQLTSYDALLIRSVLGTEGVLSFGFGIFGIFKVGEFPHADPVTALNECVGRICIYREKGIFLRVKLERVTVDDESVFLSLHVIDTAGFNAYLNKLEVGSSLNYLNIGNGHATNCMPGWTLITGNAFVEHLTNFAGTLPTRQLLIKEISNTLNPNFGHQMALRADRLL